MMQIIISPARQMKSDPDALPYQSLPVFLPQAEVILADLKQRSVAELKAIWQCSDRLVQQNVDRLATMTLTEQLTPALLAFTGLQYQAMGPGVFDDEAWDYVQRHLRILSGFYGVLKPLDGIMPYRLGLSDAAQVAGTANLYQYWGNRLAEEVYREGELVLNLASVEYAKAIKPYLTPARQLVTCLFGEVHAGKFKQKATQAKQARGNMVRYLAEHQVTTLAGVKKFAVAGFQYQPALSTPTKLVFVKA